MSIQESLETGYMSVYDDRGRTQIPADVRRAMDLSEGDTVKLVVEDGIARLYKIENNGTVSI